MIPIIEDYLNELLDSRFAYLKANTSQLSGIFKTSQPRIDKLAAYLQANPIKVIKGYPRTSADVPCVCILLSAETETQEGLGDYGDSEDNDIRSNTENATVVNDNTGVLQMPYVQLASIPLHEITSITNITTSEVLDPSEYYIASAQQGLIAIPTGEVEDGDELSIEFTYIYSSANSVQVLYEADYRLECWSPNSDLTVNLYHLTKWALLTGRDTLVTDVGLVRQKLGGGDFEPAPAYFPEFVYRRALTFWAQFTTSVPSDADLYITSVEVEEVEFTP